MVLCLSLIHIFWEDKLGPIADKYFEETGVKVNIEYYEHTNYFPALEAKMSAKSSDLDIIGVDVPMTSGYAEKGYIIPLNEYFSENEINEFVPAAIDAGSWKGDFYAPPMNTSAAALYYNAVSYTHLDACTQPAASFALADYAAETEDESYCLLWEAMNAAFEQLGAQGCTAANCVFTDGMIILMR